MAQRYPHLRLARVERENPRRRRGGFGGARPDDPKAHARDLDSQIEEHSKPLAEEIPGFDPRRLLRVTVEGVTPEDLEAIPGLSLVVQEGRNFTILFASDEGLAEFRSRLQAIAEGRSATRKDVLFAVKAFDDITPEDRTGPALRVEGGPGDRESAHLDVELWPLELANERDAMRTDFRAKCAEREIEILDEVNNPAIVLLRVSASEEQCAELLRMRDVRQVDLPPRYQLDTSLFNFDVEDLPDIPSPPEGAPGVVVVDTGIVANHPLLGAAVGDAQGFVPEDDSAHDEAGHGSAVAGLALYGDVQACVESRSFVPAVRLFAARIAGDASGSETSDLLENRITRAVEYFRSTYGCSVFVLAFGDARKPYTGAHVDRLAATLDALARTHGVLFVVAAGNFDGGDDGPADWREQYPEYLFSDEARIIDPAPAVNALTVGSLARHERSNMAHRFPLDPAHQPIARRDEPSPFTRSGPGPGGAIKPELVEYGGNRYVDTRSNPPTLSPGRQLGELSSNIAFAAGHPLCVDNGTSFAAAKVGHLATRVLVQQPDASPNLIRALLVAHADVPEAAEVRLGDPRRILQVVGYGRPKHEQSQYSSESQVTLFAEEEILPDQHHFYEVPLPDDLFTGPARRLRRITVAIAHAPRVRRTRLEYKESAVSFRVVRADGIEDVTQAFRRLKKEEMEPSIAESGFWPSPNIRGGGTVQRASRFLRQLNAADRGKPYFIVVTNSVPAWGNLEDPEPYALVLVVEDLSGEDVKLYAQIRAELQARARARARA